MKKRLFAEPAAVLMHGSRVLDLLAVESDHISFSLIGFDNQVLIFDYRLRSIENLAYLLETGEAADFIKAFNSPAYTTVDQIGGDSYEVLLLDTDEETPEFRLWMVVGLNDELPVYDYLFYDVRPYQEDRYAVFACYHRLPFGRAIVELENSESGYPEGTSGSFGERSALVSSQSYL
jgi:hypothetical protein